MKTCGFLVASLFGALAAAAPVQKRDIVWVTETAVDYVTLAVTQTVWVGADEATSTPASSSTPAVNIAAIVRPTHTRHTLSSASTSSSVYVAPTTSSVYVAPTTSSTSAYVAPTTSAYVEPTTSSTSVYVAPTTSSTSVYVAPTTSSTSVYVAPTTSSTSVYVAPVTTQAPTSAYVAPSTTSSSAAATTSSSSSSGGLAASGTSYTGEITYYDVGMGSCGLTSTAGEAVVAISKEIFDAPGYATANPNNNPLCGRYVSITGKDGSQHKAKVVDRCVGCVAADLDLSASLFETVTGTVNTRVPGMTWTWV